MFAGRYQVRIHCEGNRYVVSAVCGGSDLLANPILTVQPGVTPPPIEIGMKPGGGQFKGRLAVPGANPSMVVLLVPAFAISTGPEIGALSPAAGPWGKWEFEFPSLAPGDYVAYAVPDADDVEYSDPAFLQSLTGGVAVHVEDGTEKQIEIRRPAK